MNAKEQVNNAKKFIEFWRDKGYEKGESQKFWMSLLQDVLGVDDVTNYINFEDKVVIDKTSFIDAFIPSTKVLIEQKSINKDLRKGIKQSDGSFLTPFQQAKRYSAELPYSSRPRWIITCNFKEFLIYDMEKPRSEPESILLENLHKEYYRLEFIVNNENEILKKEMEVSIKAGEVVGLLYDALIKQYKNPDNIRSLESLNMLCVRIVFCLYAEDAGIFGKHGKFHDYLKNLNVRDVRRGLIDLFKTLDTKVEDRDPYMDEELASFPYVNGGLFEDENIEIPNFTEEIVNLILHNASEDFNWREISPTIFGAVFESTLNPNTRRSGGMHYTSIENIHKVIDPLFLNDLERELEEKKALKVEKVRKEALLQYQKKLSELIFLDPACGSGNFLTETYLSLRRLENKTLEAIYDDRQIFLDDELVTGESVIKVSINQFYGIEINDFAVTVAKTAMWIAESQMMKETEEIVHKNLDYLPLKSYVNIVEENSLRVDWESIVSKYKLNYIIGNPPFLGARYMNKCQKDDMLEVFGKIKKLGDLDYVSAWYKKAYDYIKGTRIKVVFVSTNSITQGEQVAVLWKSLENLKIHFAYKTFKWDSEASEKANVHCVIICFAVFDIKEKILFYDDTFKKVKNINPYLLDAKDVYIESRNNPICNVPKMDSGSMPNDGGFLSKFSEADINEIINKYPQSKDLFRRFYGAEEFIKNKKRYCLWLKGVSPSIINKIPPVVEAIRNTKEKRLESSREATRKLADTPYLFAEIRQPDTDYLLVPTVSSGNRKYIPIGFMSKEDIAYSIVSIVPNATLYHFGVLTSNVHMAWMRAFAGRIKSDYRYSIKVVYNNFPWCNPSKEDKELVEKTAQMIIDARNMYPECSFAELYNELTMPKELMKAHRENDKAVMKAYGFSVKNMTESECVTELVKMYEKLIR